MRYSCINHHYHGALVPILPDISPTALIVINRCATVLKLKGDSVNKWYSKAILKLIISTSGNTAYQYYLSKS